MNTRRELSINSVIESLILSDFFTLFGLGLLSPIFAIYISQQIVGGDLKVIGLATAIYWGVRSVLVTPLGRYMDRKNGERDEFLFMFFGTLIAAFIPLFYISASRPWHLFVLQGILAISYSMAVPGWRILFTNHLDRGKTGYEWSLEDTGVGLSTAVAAYVGAVIAEHFGFTAVLLCVSAAGFMGVLLLLPIRHQIKNRREVQKLRKARLASDVPLPPKVKTKNL